MPELNFVRYSVVADDADYSHITDLALVRPTPSSAPLLYATTRYDGIISAWNIGGTALSRLGEVSHTRDDVAGLVTHLGLVEVGGSLSLITGGGITGSLELRDLEASDGFSTRTVLGPVDLPGDLGPTVSYTLPTGVQMVYGGIVDGGGIGRLQFTADGLFETAAYTGARVDTYAGRVAALTVVEVGGEAFVLTADTERNGVTSYEVRTNGSLNAMDNADAEDRLWTSSPTAIASGQAFGQSFAVLAAAGSSSLSVIEVSEGGSLRVTDHVLDNRDTRFFGVSVLETVEHHGRTYVITAGQDDGISIFQILPGGRLLSVAHLEDSTQMSLANVSALTAQSLGNGIDIYVASSSERGLTRLRLETGSEGAIVQATGLEGNLWGTGAADMMLGSNDDDALYAGSGDDVLMDGLGEDILYGGDGADIFVLSSDGETDRITDFQQGLDRIDLSNWDMLRNIGQLAITPTASGFEVAYGDEQLIVDASGPVNVDALEADDLIGVMRIWSDTPTEPGDIVGTINVDALSGDSANNRLFGLGSDDMLEGMEGDDRLYGGTGDDTLQGGTGADIMGGQAGDDLYYVDNPGDVIEEAAGEGTDRVATSVSYALAAGAEVEVLTTTSFGGISDIDLTGNGFGQSITGNAGDNVLSTGGGVGNVLRGAGGDDLYRLYSTSDRVIEGPDEGGLDRINTAVDFTLLATNYIEVLATNGASGTSAIDLTGNALAQTILGNAGDNTLSDGGGAADVLQGYGGNDVYILRADGSRVIEAAGGGTDRIAVDHSFTLDADIHVEHLTTTSAGGTTSLDLTGNSLTQEITGNAGVNTLTDGGGAGDVLNGYKGDDFYIVRSSATQVIEGVGYGTDRVAAGVDFDLGAGAEVEVLTTTSFGGTAPINLTGNSYAQSLTGNAGDNILSTGGGAGNVLRGAGGNDLYRVYSSTDRIIEGPTEGTLDRVNSSVDFTLRDTNYVEVLATNGVSGTANIALTGNAFAQTILGNNGDNMISDGGSAADVMQGYGGDDFYILRGAGSRVIEATGGGTDRIATDSHFTLEAGVEVEMLTTTSSGGATTISLWGNEFAQTIVGNAGTNRLEGGGGQDVLTGGAGTDTFVFNADVRWQNRTEITDYNPAQDRIFLKMEHFAGTNQGWLGTGYFRANTSGQAQDASDRIIYETDTGRLFYDADGFEAGSRIWFGTLDAGLSMSAGEFYMM